MVRRVWEERVGWAEGWGRSIGGSLFTLDATLMEIRVGRPNERAVVAERPRSGACMHFRRVTVLVQPLIRCFDVAPATGASHHLGDLHYVIIWSLAPFALPGALGALHRPPTFCHLPASIPVLR